MSALSLALYEATQAGASVRFYPTDNKALAIECQTNGSKITRRITELSLKQSNGLDYLFIHMIGEMTDQLPIPKKTLRKFTEEYK